MTDKIQDLNIENIGNWISDLLQHPIISRIILPILLLVLGWVFKNYYDKHYGIRPKSLLKLGNSLYGQRLLGIEIGHELTWRYEVELKNNSKHDAYNIETFELKADEEIISNKAHLKFNFPKNNHLSSNEVLKFEISKKIEVNADVLIKSEIEKGKKFYIKFTKTERSESSKIKTIRPFLYRKLAK